MTASMYRKHTLFSRPYYDDKLEVWMTSASVVQEVFRDGDQNNFYYHEMKDLKSEFRERRTSVMFRLHHWSVLD